MSADTAPVFLIEDDEALRTILARHLRARGIDIEVAASAEDAVLALAAGLRPSLVLLDINLPGETGWEFLRRPDLALAGSPPVVITSAAAISPRQLAEFDVAGYLPKPFASDALIAVVRRAIGERGATARP